MAAIEANVYIVSGGTRGIGYGLARELLRLGQKVIICGRGDVEKAVLTLGEFIPGECLTKERVRGIRCDISNYADVENLWQYAVHAFERVDVFVNNAGLSNEGKNLVDLSPELIKKVVDVNVTGSMNCCRVAMLKMQAQAAGGRFYLMEGLGSDGRARAGQSVYGATKSAVRVFMRGMQQEAKGTNVKIGCLSPGMVTTDLLMNRYRRNPDEFSKVRTIFNILCEHETTTTPWLAQQLVADQMEARYLTPLSVMWRFVKYGIFCRRDLFADDPDFART